MGTALSAGAHPGHAAAEPPVRPVTWAVHASAIFETIHRERVSVLVSVPKLLVNLQHEIERRFHPPDVPARRKGIPGIFERWWRYRKVHAALGFKFWAVIV